MIQYTENQKDSSKKLLKLINVKLQDIKSTYKIIAFLHTKDGISEKEIKANQPIHDSIKKLKYLEITYQEVKDFQQ